MRRQSKHSMIRRFKIPMLFLTAVLGLVYASPFQTSPLKAEKRVNQKAAAANEAVEILRDAAFLPPEVDRMRRAILSAASSGDIAEMRVPIEMNEIPPIVAPDKPSDPIAYWNAISGDGEGRDILATFIRLFRAGYTRNAAGTDDELYVWPYFAEMPIDSLTPAQEVELLTIVSPERFNAMKASGRYDFYRIGIGHDGTWHFFVDKDG